MLGSQINPHRNPLRLQGDQGLDRSSTRRPLRANLHTQAWLLANSIEGSLTRLPKSSIANGDDFQLPREFIEVLFHPLYTLFSN
jgi:hypothetical protein